MKRLFLSCAFVLLAGCLASPQADGDGGTPPGAVELAEGEPVEKTEVDTRCARDADCAVKNVGNCCGYFPACVNKDSPTFPDRVKAQCEAQGMASVCGFREITECQCVEGRCSAAGDPR